MQNESVYKIIADKRHINGRKKKLFNNSNALLDLDDDKIALCSRRHSTITNFKFNQLCNLNQILKLT